MDTEWPRGVSNGSALVLVQDRRVALAAVLVLQEMCLSVDVATDLEAAADWSSKAGYDVILFGAADHPEPKFFARRLRQGSPYARVIMLAGAWADSSGLAEHGIEVVHPPIDVNTLVTRLRPAAAA